MRDTRVPFLMAPWTWSGWVKRDHIGPGPVILLIAFETGTHALEPGQLPWPVERPLLESGIFVSGLFHPSYGIL